MAHFIIVVAIVVAIAVIGTTCINNEFLHRIHDDGRLISAGKRRLHTFSLCDNKNKKSVVEEKY
jgi:hypothetical protein